MASSIDAVITPVQTKTAGSSFPVALPAIAAGKTILLFVTFDNLTGTTPTVSSIGKPGGETGVWERIASWDAPATGAAASLRGEAWRINAATAWSAGSQTVQLSASVAAKIALGYVGSDIGTATFAVTNASGASTLPAAFAPSGGVMVLFSGWESNATQTWSGGAAFALDTSEVATSGGGGAANLAARIGTSSGGLSDFNFGGSADSGAMRISFARRHLDGFITTSGVGAGVGTISATGLVSAALTGTASLAGTGAITPTGKPNALVFRQTNSSLINDILYSFPSIPIGVAHANRRVIVAIHVEGSAPGVTYAVTINGITPTVDVDSGGGITPGNFRVMVVSAVVPTGTTATVALSASGSGATRVYIGTWTIIGALPTGSTDAELNTSNSSVVVTTNPGDYVIAGWVAANGVLAPGWGGSGNPQSRYTATIESFAMSVSGVDAEATGSSAQFDFAMTGSPTNRGVVAVVYGNGTYRDAALNGTAAITASGYVGGLMFRDVVADEANQPSYTFNVPLGDPSASRRVIVAVHARGPSAIGSVTIGGILAGVDVNAGAGIDGGDTRLLIASAVVPTDTSADVVVAIQGGGNASRVAIGVWTAEGVIPTGRTDTDLNADAGVLTVPTEIGDFVVAAGIAAGEFSPVAWSGAEERYDFLMESADQYSGADVVAFEDPTLITYVLDNLSDYRGFVAAAYGTDAYRTAALDAVGSITASGTASGGSDLSGTASRAGTGSIVATGRATGSVARTGTGAIAATGVLGTSRSAALSGAGAITATGVVGISKTATLAGTGSVVATGGATGSAAVVGTGAVTASGSAAKTASAAITGTGSVAATGSTGRTATALLDGYWAENLFNTVVSFTVGTTPGTVALAGTGSIAATASSGSGATIAAVGAIVASGAAAGARTATLAGTGAIAATGVVGVSASATLSGTGTTGPTGTSTGVAAVSGVGVIGATGSANVTASAALAGVGAIVASPSAALAGTAVLTGVGAVAATGAGAGTAALAGVGGISASGVLGVSRTANLAGTGSVVASGTVAKSATASLVGTGTINPSGTGQFIASASLAGTGAIVTTTRLGRVASAALSGTASVSASGQVTGSKSATRTGTGSITATGSTGKSASAARTGTGSIAATGVRGVEANATLGGSGVIAATGQVHRSASAALTGVGAVTPASQSAKTSTAAVAGVGTIAAAGSVGVSSTASLAGTGSATSTHTLGFASGAVLGGSGTITATEVFAADGSTTLAGVGVISAWGDTNVATTATVDGIGSLTASGFVVTGEEPCWPELLGLVPLGPVSGLTPTYAGTTLTPVGPQSSLVPLYPGVTLNPMGPQSDLVAVGPVSELVPLGPIWGLAVEDPC